MKTDCHEVAVPVFSYKCEQSGNKRTMGISSDESSPLISQAHSDKFKLKKWHIAIFVLVMFAVFLYVFTFILTIVVCRFVNVEPDQWNRGVAEYCRVAMGRLI